MKAWIEDDNINYEYIIRYLRETIPKSEGQLLQMEFLRKEMAKPFHCHIVSFFGTITALAVMTCNFI